VGLTERLADARSHGIPEGGDPGRQYPIPADRTSTLIIAGDTLDLTQVGFLSMETMETSVPTETMETTETSVPTETTETTETSIPTETTRQWRQVSFHKGTTCSINRHSTLGNRHSPHPTSLRPYGHDDLLPQNLSLRDTLDLLGHCCGNCLSSTQNGESKQGEDEDREQSCGYEGCACRLCNQAKFQTDLRCCNDECKRCCL
jgi:hypothetical protein